MKFKQFILKMVIAASLGISFTNAATITPGQSVSVREGDVWSDATIQKIEGRKYQVKYSDGTEEWVTADRIKAKSDVPAANVAESREKPVIKTETKGIPVSLTGPFTPIELKPAKGVDKRANVPIFVKPTTRPSAPFTDLTPASGVPFRSVDELLICPDTPNIAIAIGDRQGEETPLLCIDVLQPANIETRVLSAKDHRVIAAANGGKTVITRPDDSRSQTLSLWEYNGSEYQLRANYSFVLEGTNARPDVVMLLSANRMVLRSGFGENYLIDLTTKRQIGYIKCGDLRIHCSGQYLLASKDQAKVIIRPSDLSILLELQSHDSIFCLDPTGAFVANGDERSLAVSKLATKSQVSQIGGITRSSRADLLTQDKLLLDGKYYYDLKTGIPVWKYDAGPGKSVLLSNGLMLYVTQVNEKMNIAMVAIPDEAAAKALTESKPELFEISPGARIAIAGDLSAIGDATEVRKNVDKAIKTAGHVSDDAATEFKLTFNTVAGPTGKFSTREFSMGSGPVIREVDAPSTIVTATLTKGETTIWTREMKFGAQFMITRKPNQSLEDAVAEAGRPNPSRIGFLDIPGYMVKGNNPKEVGTLGASTLTSTGFSKTTNLK